MSTVTAFLDDGIVAAGDRHEVARPIEQGYGPADLGAIRVFENEGGRIIDLDYNPPRTGEGDRGPQARGGGVAAASEMRAKEAPRPAAARSAA